MNRRRFLRHASKAIALSSFPLSTSMSLPAYASEEKGPFFVMIRLKSGWDVSLGLDPQVHTITDQNDIFLEYRSDEIFRIGNQKLGPALSPLYSYSEDFSIVNGILMNTSDNGHEASLGFITTGNGEGKAPPLPVEIAAASKAGPLGVVFKGESIALDRPVILTTTDNVLNMASMIQLKAFKGFFQLLNGGFEFTEALTSLIDNSQATDALVAAINERVPIINENNGSESIREGHILAAAFTAGASNQAQIDFFVDLDTHDNHEGRHLDAQRSGWDSVAQIFKIFKETPFGGMGDSLFSRTTFMVVSDFSRTPFLNASKGKDHNPLTNSVLLAGRNILGGQTLGASHVIPRSKSELGVAQHTALPIDFSNGEVAISREMAEKPNFQYITPDRVVASVAEAVGVDRQKFNSTSFEKGVLKTILKNI